MKVLLLTGDEERHRSFRESVPHHAFIVDGLHDDINNWKLVAEREHPDVIFVYGTRKLCPEWVRGAPYVLNLHGGDPERYRGLDSNLWALYNQDYDALQVTLHHVDDELDTGDIVFQTQFELPRSPSLGYLQAETTRVCIRLALLALVGIKSGFLPRRPQRTLGRYYSRIPEELRERCETNLRQLAA